MTTGMSRDPFGDSIRGLAIIGVVAIHSLDSVLPSALYQAVSACLRWCVPAFIFLTAFYTAAPNWTTTGEFVALCLTRIQRLAWPFILYSALYLLLNKQPFEIPLNKLFTTHLSGYGWPGQYYFIILFQLTPIVYWLARRGVTAHELGAIWVLGLVVYAWAPMGYREFPFLSQLADRPFPYWLPYVALGVYSARHRDVFKLIAARIPAHTALIVGLLAPLILIWAGPQEGHESPYLRPQVLIASTLFLGAARLVCDQLTPPRWLQYIGRYSLAIFCLNPLFIWLLRSHLPALNSTSHPWSHAAPLALVFVALVIAASLITGKLLQLIGLRKLVA